MCYTGILREYISGVFCWKTFNFLLDIIFKGSMILQSSRYSPFFLFKCPLVFGAIQALLEGCKPWLCAKAACWAERSLSYRYPKINYSSLVESCGASCHALLSVVVDWHSLQKKNKVCVPLQQSNFSSQKDGFGLVGNLLYRYYHSYECIHNMFLCLLIFKLSCHCWCLRDKSSWLWSIRYLCPLTY